MIPDSPNANPSCIYLYLEVTFPGYCLLHYSFSNWPHHGTTWEPRPSQDSGWVCSTTYAGECRAHPSCFNVQPSMRIQVLINYSAVFIFVLFCFLFSEGKVFLFLLIASSLAPSLQHSSQLQSVIRKLVRHFIELCLAHNTVSSIQIRWSLFCLLHAHSSQSGRNMVHND